MAGGGAIGEAVAAKIAGVLLEPPVSAAAGPIFSAASAASLDPVIAPVPAGAIVAKAVQQERIAAITRGEICIEYMLRFRRLPAA